MLSLGTEFFLAFWMASKRVGLPAGSPPPVRAATSTFLIRRANSLPRRASTTAFLCLVVAHLEWPDISSNLRLVLVSLVLGHSRIPGSTCPDPPHHLHEVRMDPHIAGEFWMKGGGEEVSLPNRDNPTGGTTLRDSTEDLDTLANPLDPGRPDEDGVERATVNPVDDHRRLERVHLTS